MVELDLEVKKKKVITLFDVAPHQILKNKNFYNDETAIKFIKDILSVKNKIQLLSDFIVQIKPKRELNRRVHSEKYIDFLQDLVQKGEIRLVPWDSNPYTLVSESQIIISIPFTTAAYIGIEMGTESIFYFPSKRKLANSIYDDEIQIVHGNDELLEYFTSINLNNVI
jgi:polysaccharide biosynthesis PFTS motif protein